MERRERAVRLEQLRLALDVLRSRLPELELEALDGRPVERDRELLPRSDSDRVDVDRIVPVVRARANDGRPAPELRRERAGVVVRLHAVRSRQRSGERPERCGDVEAPPARDRIAAGQAMRTAVRRRHVVGRPLEERRQLVGGQSRVDGEEQGRCG